MNNLNNKHVVAIIKFLFLLVGLYYIYYEIQKINFDFIFNLNLLNIFIPFIFFLLGTSLFAYVWFLLLVTEKNISVLETIKIYFQGQLGKYIPGSIWSALGRIGLAVDMGLDFKFVSRNTLNHLIYLWSSCLIVALIFMLNFEVSIFIFLIVVIFLIFTNNKNKIYYFFGWICIAVGYILLFNSFEKISIIDLNPIISGSLFSWLGGFLFLPAPSGIGVREYILNFLLENKHGFSDVFIVATLARALTLFNDLAGYFFYNLIFKFYTKK